MTVGEVGANGLDLSGVAEPMMFAPLAARPRAMPRPIPLVEPVTMADFPDNMAMPLRIGMNARTRRALRDCRCRNA
jgi:hypothetical protein